MCTEAIGEVVHSLYQQPHHSDVLLRRLKLDVVCTGNGREEVCRH